MAIFSHELQFLPKSVVR